ncbi:hypothetical protein AB0C06_22360 [Micromonospora inaquosa]|uniref:Uncharacterized protein n=1 Tax=Micromonospora inaquosa TaxID=2203716 RepID=A0A3N9WPC3_9ACTN|nr:hypothetical protein [Micromonospora inaquosa]RQX02549.1 hypothetical protein DLJ59_15070 [Micromonospora inaquosa]
MTDSGEYGRRPDRWRPALGPLGAVWVAGAAFAIAPCHDPRRLDLASNAADGWPPAASAAAAFVLVWAAIGLLVPLLAEPIAALWLGQWPIGAGALTARRRERWSRADQLVDRLASEGASAESQARAVARRTAIAPAPPRRPTWMGDRWFAVEQRIAGAYGLDLVTVWPRLWLALPEPARAELRAAKAGWDRSAQLAAWAGAFAALGLAWWPPLCVAAVLGVAGWLRGRAAVAYRADLIEAAFDLHAARLPGLLVGLDTDAGRRLSAHLRKGT